MAIDPLVMMAHDLCDLGVILDPGKDSLSDLAVLLHHAPLVERQGPGFLEKSGGKSDLADVMDKSSKVNESMLLVAQGHPAGDIARVNRDGRGMTRGVAIARVERRHERAGE